MKTKHIFIHKLNYENWISNIQSTKKTKLERTEGNVFMCISVFLWRFKIKEKKTQKLLVFNSKKKEEKNKKKIMDTEYVPFLLVTANVGSVFEDVSALLFHLHRALVAILKDLYHFYMIFYFIISVWRWLLFCFELFCYRLMLACAWVKKKIYKNILHELYAFLWGWYWLYFWITTTTTTQKKQERKNSLILHHVNYKTQTHEWKQQNKRISHPQRNKRQTASFSPLC